MCHGGDHGKGKFRLTTKIIVKTNSGENISIIYPLADVKCKKDNGAVIKSTILPKIVSGVNRLADCSIKLTEHNGLWCATLEDPRASTEAGSVTIIPQTYLSGDLAYLCMIVGKEGYEGDWCYLCDLFKVMWRDVEHMKGKLWTTDTLIARHESNIEQKAKGTSKSGVRNFHFLRKCCTLT